MKLSALPFICLLAVSVAQVSCSESSRTVENKQVGAVSADGKNLAEDVLTVTKPLISGELYNQPSFESASLTRFSTDQEIQVLDTTDALFVRVRIQKDTENFIGFVAKAILPE